MVEKGGALRIGVTGGIGSGKSYVCHLLENRGFPVYYCDDEAKRLMTCHPDIMRDMSSLLGEEVYLPANTVSSKSSGAAGQEKKFELNKPLVAAFLFASCDNAKKINSIVHPRVKQDFLQWAAQQDSNLVFVESAILQEADFLDVLDAVLLVSAPDALRLRRAMQRDNASEQQIRLRMSRQLSQDDMRSFSHYEIINDGETDLFAAIDSMLTKLFPDAMLNMNHH